MVDDTEREGGRREAQGLSIAFKGRLLVRAPSFPLHHFSAGEPHAGE